MIRYADSGGVSIAYDSRGAGPPTLVYGHGFVGNRAAGTWRLHAVTAA